LRQYRGELEKSLGTDALDDQQINSVGVVEFDKAWRGVSDQSTFRPIPGYHIVNTSYSPKSRGVHWLGIYVTKGRKIYVFDSYNRNINVVSNKLYERYGNQLRDPNDQAYQQGETSAICGHASLAWLMVVRDFGIKTASTDT
jgi:hypothetical protein